MVELEAEGGDLLTLRFGPPYAPEDEDAYLGALEAIGARAAPFALLAVFGGRGRLSPAGESIYAEIAPLALAFEKRLLDGMAGAEREALFRLLDRLDELELQAEADSAGV